MMGYFRWAFIATGAGLVLAFWFGWGTTGTLSGAMSFLFVGTVLAILEISLSFDNAIVNANTLKTMDPVWQRRFLTWGILIAVFGMRLVFPLAVVAVAAQIGPVAALWLAIAEPGEYARIMEEAHLAIVAFGGTFLMMVGLDYFIDERKDIDWFRALERRFRRGASIKGLEITLVLLVVLGFSMALPEYKAATFLFAAIFGLVSYTAIRILGQSLDAPRETVGMVGKAGLGAFLYLEVLDASFSFDGVIGAFALTKNLVLIAIGLGIGAMYVRTMTIMLVERETLTQFRYLEHGAFYSILALSIIMFAQSIWHIPEAVTGLIGAGLIGVALWSSIRYNRKAKIA